MGEMGRLSERDHQPVVATASSRTRPCHPAHHVGAVEGAPYSRARTQRFVSNLQKRGRSVLVSHGSVFTSSGGLHANRSALMCWRTFTRPHPATHRPPCQPHTAPL